jgi:hypothetical protein
MTSEKTIRCENCGIPIPEPPEKSDYTELLCDTCLKSIEDDYNEKEECYEISITTYYEVSAKNKEDALEKAYIRFKRDFEDMRYHDLDFLEIFNYDIISP